MTDAKARAAFKGFSTDFDPASDNWTDMDAEALFVAGYAAAIREDRAEPVSEAEVDAAKVMLREYDPCTFHNSAYNRTKFKSDIRAALEAARQARATADEKGGAR